MAGLGLGSRAPDPYPVLFPQCHGLIPMLQTLCYIRVMGRAGNLGMLRRACLQFRQQQNQVIDKTLEMIINSNILITSVKGTVSRRLAPQWFGL